MLSETRPDDAALESPYTLSELLKCTMLTEAQEVDDGLVEVAELIYEQGGCVFQGSQFSSDDNFRKHQHQRRVRLFNKPLEIAEGCTAKTTETSNNAGFLATRTYAKRVMHAQFRVSYLVPSKLTATEARHDEARAPEKWNNDLHVQGAKPREEPDKAKPEDYNRM